MESAEADQLLNECHICKKKLRPHPLYFPSVARSCSTHGDFFIQRLYGQEAIVVFRPLEGVVIREKKEPTKQKRIENPRGRPEPIRCDQTGVIFRSIAQAARDMNLEKSSISRHLAGARKSIGGYSFTRVDHSNANDLIEKIPLKSLGYRLRIKCNETEQIFESIKEASEVLGINRSAISGNIKGKYRCAHVGGYTFTKIAQERPLTSMK